MTVMQTVLESTLTKSRRKLIMASIKSNALMAWAFANNRVEVENGGYNITNPLTVGRNQNVTSYEYFGALPVAQTSEFDTVEYRWSRVAGTVIISDQEEDENIGPEAIFKLITAKVDVLEESIKEKFSEYLYGSGTGTDPNGLAALVPDNPTTGTLAGIDRAVESQWRTSSYDFDGNLDATNIEEAMDDIMLDLTVKGEKPSVWLMGRNMYRLYKQAVREKIVINLGQTGGATKTMFDLSIEGIMHGKVPILYDEDCPVNKAYALNDKYLRLHILKGVNMRVKNLAAPWTIDASGKRIVWQGQWCTWRNFRTHAVIINS